MARLVLYLCTLLALLGLLACLAESSSMRFCCTDYTKKPIPKRMLKDYTVQKVTEGCGINAVVFRTVRNRFACADPNRKWVQDGINFIHEKKAKRHQTESFKVSSPLTKSFSSPDQTTPGF